LVAENGTGNGYTDDATEALEERLKGCRLGDIVLVNIRLRTNKTIYQFCLVSPAQGEKTYLERNHGILQ
jgi:hypothetical protein